MNVARLLTTKSKNIITIHPEQTIREALALLAKHNIGALVIVGESGQPVGIVSERDIVRELARQEEIFTRPVHTVMTKNVITGVPQDDLKSVANTMTEKRIRHLPVIDHNELIGIVSIGDVVKAQRDQYQGEVDTLQTQILGDEA